MVADVMRSVLKASNAVRMSASKLDTDGRVEGAVDLLDGTFQNRWSVLSCAPTVRGRQGP